MKKIKFRPEGPEEHEGFIWDDPQGELVYVSEEMSSLERTDSEMVFTIRMPKCVNWKMLADIITEECREVCRWTYEQRHEHQYFEDLPVVEEPTFEVDAVLSEVLPDPDTDEDCEEDVLNGMYDGTEPVYMLMRTDHWWEMYESDDDYLIRYRLPKCEKYPLSCRDDLDALGFLLNDEMADMTSFLREMYDKVNGYTEESVDENEEEDD